MNHIYLYLAFWYILLIAFPTLRLCIFIVGMLYALYTYEKQVCIYICMIAIFCIVFLFDSYQNIQTNILKIEAIKTNYAIAENGYTKVILYNVKDVMVDDIVLVHGEYESVYSQKNANTYMFETYLKHKGIYESMYVENYETLKKGNSIRSKIYSFIYSMEDIRKNNLLSLFYKIDEENNSLISLSGMHLHFLSMLIAKLLDKRKNVVDIGIASIFYVCFIKSASIVCMLVFALCKELFKNKDRKDVLGICILATLLYDTSFIYEISFQLIVLYSLISIFDCVHIHNKVKTFFILFPIQLYHFHSFNIIQFLLFPFLRIYQALVFCVGVLNLVFPFLTSILNTSLEIYETINTYVENSYCIIGKPYFIWMVGWFWLVIKMMSRKQDTYVLKFTMMLCAQILLPYMHPLGEVTFLDVGQGDAILIREAFNQKVIMIDVAGKVDDTLVEKRIYPYLKMEGIRKIDTIFITHDDYDHVGGLEELGQFVSIDKVIYDKKDVCFHSFCMYQVNTNTYEDENDASMVLYAHIGTLDYLFMGDASIEVEKDIMEKYNELDADVLKVGHHGSKTSSSDAFIAQIHPLISVISSGKNNVYKHPNKEVLEILSRNDSYILNTQENGSISIFFTSFINFLRTGNNEFAIIR